MHLSIFVTFTASLFLTLSPHALAAVIDPPPTTSFYDPSAYINDRPPAITLDRPPAITLDGAPPSSDPSPTTILSTAVSTVVLVPTKEATIVNLSTTPKSPSAIILTPIPPPADSSSTTSVSPSALTNVNEIPPATTLAKSSTSSDPQPATTLVRTPIPLNSSPTATLSPAVSSFVLDPTLATIFVKLSNPSDSRPATALTRTPSPPVLSPTTSLSSGALTDANGPLPATKVSPTASAAIPDRRLNTTSTSPTHSLSTTSTSPTHSLSTTSTSPTHSLSTTSTSPTHSLSTTSTSPNHPLPSSSPPDRPDIICQGHVTCYKGILDKLIELAVQHKGDDCPAEPGKPLVCSGDFCVYNSLTDENLGVEEALLLMETLRHHGCMGCGTVPLNSRGRSRGKTSLDDTYLIVGYLEDKKTGNHTCSGYCPTKC